MPRLISILIAGLSLAAAPPGVVIDHSPAKSKQYIGSPGLAVLADGTYVASHDFFGPGTSYDTSVVFRSRDRGATWSKLATLKGQWWSTLFVHNDALYLMGTTKEYGHAVIRRSTDGGTTWTTPKDATTGLLLADGMYHCAPVPVLTHNGRLWRGMEQYAGPKWGAFSAFMMSAPVDADLLNAKSWTSSNRLDRNPDWLGGTFNAWLEGNAVAMPDGKVVDILRVDQPYQPEKAAIVRISDDGRTASFDPAKDFIEMPGGAKKFAIRYDEKSKRYWSLSTVAAQAYPNVTPSRTRNRLSLLSSEDLRNWTTHRTVMQHDDVHKHGFQYVEWLFDGDDLIAAVRCAWDEADGTPAHNAHDANYLLFVRVPKFRDVTRNSP